MERLLCIRWLFRFCVFVSERLAKGVALIFAKKRFVPRLRAAKA